MGSSLSLRRLDRINGERTRCPEHRSNARAKYRRASPKLGMFEQSDFGLSLAVTMRRMGPERRGAAKLHRLRSVAWSQHAVRAARLRAPRISAPPQAHRLSAGAVR